MQEEYNKLLVNYSQLVADQQIIQRQLHRSIENLDSSKEESELRKCRYENIIKTQQTEIQKLLHENDKLRMTEATIHINSAPFTLDDNTVEDAEDLLTFENNESLKQWLQEVDSIKSSYMEKSKKEESKNNISTHISTLAGLTNQQKEIINVSDNLIGITTKELEFNKQITELNSKISEYSNQNKLFLEEINAVKKRNAELTQKVAYLENAIQTQSVEWRAKLNEENYSHQSILNAAITQQEYDISNIKNQLSISEQSAIMLKERIKMLQECEQMYNSRINEIENLLKQKEEQIANKSTENQSLVIENTKFKGDLLVLNTQINSLQAKYVGVELENQKLNNQPNQESLQIWEITKQEYETIITAYKNKCNELQNIITNLEKENKALINRAEVCIRVSNGDSNELVKENEKLLSTIENLNNDISNQKQQYTAIIEGYVKLFEDEQEQKRILQNKYDTAIENGKAKQEQMQNRFNTIETELKTSINKYDLLKYESDVQNKSKQELETTLNTLTMVQPNCDEIKTLKSKILEYELVQKKYEQTHLALEADIEAFAIQKEEIKQIYEKEIFTLKKIIEAKNIEINTLYMAIEDKFPSIVSSLNVESDEPTEYGPLIRYIKSQNQYNEFNLSQIRDSHRQLQLQLQNLLHSTSSLKAELAVYKNINMIKTFEEKEKIINNQNTSIEEMKNEIGKLGANVESLTKANNDLTIKIKENEAMLTEVNEVSSKAQSELQKTKIELCETKDTYEKKINFITTQFKELSSKPKPSQQPEIASQDNRLKKMMTTLKNAKKVVEIQSKYIEVLSPEKRKKID